MSKIFNLAIDYKGYGYESMQEGQEVQTRQQALSVSVTGEEPRLMAALSGPRAHLKPLVIVAIGTGMRQGEQFRLTWDRVDLSRRVLILTKTKSGKDREIPMNPEVVKTLFALKCRSNEQDYLFVNERTKTRLKEVKKAFWSRVKDRRNQRSSLARSAGNLGTRLGEAGYDAFTIAALMGHSQIQTTARYVRATERTSEWLLKP